MSAPRRLAERFTLLEIAGKGASGEVHRALDERDGRIVAVKRLSGHLDGDHARERFAREIRFLELIDSPNVVRHVAHGVDERDDVPFVAVEWLDGEDLAHRQRARPLTGREVVEVTIEVGRGLDAIHAIGVVHRDVKPSNLFLTTSEGGLRATVIDLGVALSPTEPSLTHHGTMIGTPAYMSPEQVLGSPLTSRSDVFSLGTVVYELITGEKPYKGADALTVVAKIALSDPPHLRDVVPTVPAEVDAIVARAMAKDPSERFPSALAFGEALASAPPFRTRREPSTADEIPTALLESGASGDSSTLAAPERRVVTALFARFADAEIARGSAEAFDRIARLHGGAPRALLALGRVAVFGGALSTGDEARRAARAAFALRREIQEVDLSIATGRTRGGVDGLPADAIERGARGNVEGPTSASGVLVDGPTARLLGDAFDVARVGDDLRLLGPRGQALGVRTLLGRATPCVGRERELSQLEALFDEAEREPVARVAVVIAPAGAGKSRLGHELTSRLQRRVTAPSILVGRGSAVAEGAPFGLVGSAIRSFARIRDDEPLDAQRDKIAAAIPGPERAQLTLPIAHLAGVGIAPMASSEDGQVVSDRLREAFGRWIASLTRERPVTLLFEDVQWADAPSVTLVDAALRNLTDEPLFVVVLARPEVERRFPKIFDARGAQLFRLAKLTKKASLALVRHVAGEAVSGALVDRVVERADGNAFYLEELIRAAVEQTSDGDTPDVVELPDTVLGMVQARLDALGTEAKRLLQIAAVFGESAWPGAVADILGTTRDAVDAELSLLSEREVLERRAESRFSGESEYVFRHALLRDAAYELLLDEARAKAHLAAGRWLEAHGETDHFALAKHYDLGRAPERALGHYVEATEQSLYASDFRGVVALAERAVACGAPAVVEGHLLVSVAEAKRWSGDLRGSLVAATRAGELLSGGSASWFSAMRELVAAHGRLGNKSEIGPLAERVRAVPAAHDAHGAQIAALVPAAVHLVYNGELARASMLAREVELLAEAAPKLEPRVRGRLHQLRAILAAHDQSSEVAIAEQRSALAAFEVANDQRAATLVRSNLGFALLQIGDVDGAESVLRTALVVATRLGLGTIRPLVLQNLAVALAWRGEREEALRLQSEAADTFAALGDPRVEGASRIHLALLHLARGDLDRATREIHAVLAKELGPMEVGARATHARILLAADRAEEALAEARRAIAILDKVRSVEEFEELARLTLAEALDRAGDRAGARRALDLAKGRIEARLAKLVDPAVKKSLVERIPEHARIYELDARW